MTIKERLEHRKAIKRALKRKRTARSKQVNRLGVQRRDMFAIFILVSGGFISFFNQTLLGPAIPTIMVEYDIDASTAQWLTTIFLLVNGVMVPVTAFLIDRFTTRQLFAVSMGVFAIGAVLVAAAPSFMIVLVGRVLQAMGAGIQFPLGTVCMMRIFPKSKRGLAMGIVGVVVNFAPAIGPTVSGIMIVKYDWHLIFWYIALACVIDIIFAMIFLKNIGERRDVHLDLISIILSTLSFGGLLFGFSYAGSYGWGHAIVIVPLVLGTILLWVFAYRQTHSDDPFLNLTLLKVKDFARSVIVIMIINASLMVATVLTPIYIQNVLGYSAFYSGLAMMPGALLMCVLSPITGNIFDKIGPRKIALTGCIILVLASGYMCIMTETMPLSWLVIAYTIRAAGIAFTNMPMNTWGINALENEMIAHGNAIANTMRQMSGSLGTALLVTVMSMVSIWVADTGAVHATCIGINAAFIGSTVLSFVALVIVFFAVERKKKEK